MEHHQSHAIQHPPLHPVNHRITDLAVGQMPPPDQYIGLRQHRFGQPVFGLIQRRRAHGEFLPAQIGANGLMDPVRIDGPDRLMGFFMAKFIPDGYTYCLAHLFSLLPNSRCK
jgi:hypothetical protein